MPKRFILKLTGEVFAKAGGGLPFESHRSNYIVDEICAARREFPKLEFGIMIGGGNLIRGRAVREAFPGFNETDADYMGMMATSINCVFLRSLLENRAIKVRMMNALHIREISESYVYMKARAHMKAGIIPIFAGGGGVTRQTTDSAAINRAVHVREEGYEVVVLKGTKVPGVCDRDPSRFADAKLIPELSYTEFLRGEFGAIFDQGAVVAAMNDKVPVRIFDIFQPGNLVRAFGGETIGTCIH